MHKGGHRSGEEKHKELQKLGETGGLKKWSHRLTGEEKHKELQKLGETGG
jgi:hypothetical protein